MSRGMTVADRHEEDQESDAEPLPAGARRESPRGPEPFGDQEQEIGDGDEQRDDIDGVHGFLLESGRQARPDWHLTP